MPRRPRIMNLVLNEKIQCDADPFSSGSVWLGNGNSFYQVGRFVRGDGTKGRMREIGLAEDRGGSIKPDGANDTAWRAVV